MKAQFEQIDSPLHHSFTLRRFTLVAFDAPYHFHPEFELTLILSSHGQRFVGTSIADFRPGDLVLLGPGLPHRWRNDSFNTEPAQSIVIQFEKNFLGDSIWATPELTAVARLLGQARSGLHFTGPQATVAAEQMQALVEADPLARLTGLLHLLHTLSQADSVSLDPNYGQPDLTRSDYERINKVYGYITEHFQTVIRLDDVADLVYMTAPAFCRYVKKITRKTFVGLVNEFRIRYASQLLVHQADLPVSDVCYQSGFGNLSHFIKQFRQMTGHSPLQYRRAFTKT